MKLAVVLSGLLLSLSSFASIQSVRIIKYANPSSYSCYTPEEEQNDSKSTVSLYLGSYSDDGNGNRTFSYYNSSESLNTSSELCKRMKFIYNTVDSSLSYEEKAIYVLINEDNELVGFENPANNDLIILDK